MCLQASIFHSTYSQIKPAKLAENVGQKTQKYSLGLRVGPSVTIGHFPSNLPDTILQTHKNRPKLGFSASGQIVFQTQKDYKCLIEVGYALSGRKVDYNNNTWQNNFTYHFLTSSMGLRKSFKFYLKENLPADWFFNVGPNISYLLKGNGAIKTDNGGKTPFSLVFSNQDDSVWYNARSMRSDVDKYYFNHANRFFFGLDIGVGIDAPITNRQKIYTELRFSLGGTFIRKRDTKALLGGQIGDFNNPNPNPNLGSFSDPLTTNMKSATLSVIYTFDFDKKITKKGKSTLDKKRKQAKRRRR